MPLSLTIPDSVAQAIRAPERDREEALRVELAVVLYADGLLPFGKARELAQLGKFEFTQALGKRCITRHYGRHDLDADLGYADCQ